VSPSSKDPATQTIRLPSTRIKLAESQVFNTLRDPADVKHRAVVNEFSAETSHATMEAISPTSTNLSRGIFDSM